MNDDLLSERLHDLYSATPVPPTRVRDDLARGRARRRHRRAGGAAAGVLATAAVVGGVTWLNGPSSSTPPTPPRALDPAAPSSITPSATPTTDSLADEIRVARRVYRLWHDVLVEHLDEGGQHVSAKTTGISGGAGGGGGEWSWTTPGEQGMGKLRLLIAPDFRELPIPFCTGDPEEQCHDVEVDGTDARVMTFLGETYAGVQREGYVVVVSANSSYAQYTDVPTSSMNLTDDDLVRAAGDERITRLTAAQRRSMSAVMDRLASDTTFAVPY